MDFRLASLGFAVLVSACGDSERRGTTPLEEELLITGDVGVLVGASADEILFTEDAAYPRVLYAIPKSGGPMRQLFPEEGGSSEPFIASFHVRDELVYICLANGRSEPGAVVELSLAGGAPRTVAMLPEGDRSCPAIARADDVTYVLSGEDDFEVIAVGDDGTLTTLGLSPSGLSSRGLVTEQSTAYDLGRQEGTISGLQLMRVSTASPTPEALEATLSGSIAFPPLALADCTIGLLNNNSSVIVADAESGETVTRYDDQHAVFTVAVGLDEVFWARNPVPDSPGVRFPPQQGSIWSAPAAGGEPRQWASSDQTISNLLVDATHLYYRTSVATEDGSIEPAIVRLSRP